MTRFLLSVMILIALIFSALSAAMLVEIPNNQPVSPLKPTQIIFVSEETSSTPTTAKKTTHVDPTSIL